MYKQRIEKINEFLYREISLVLKLFIRNKKILDRSFIITKITTTNDLAYSMIYIKPLNDADGKELLKHLNHASAKIGMIISPKVMWKRFPRIHFKIDKNFGIQETLELLSYQNTENKIMNINE